MKSPYNKLNNIILYKGKEGAATVEVLFKDETMWLTQKTMGKLFDADRSVITKHLNNIFSDGELDEKSTCAIFAQVQIEGGREVTRNLNFYNLDANNSSRIPC